MLPGALWGITAAQDIVAKTHIFANFTVNSKLCAILDVGCLAHSGEHQAGEFVEKLLEIRQTHETQGPGYG
jgi:hypothetical protein